MDLHHVQLTIVVSTPSAAHAELIALTMADVFTPSSCPMRVGDGDGDGDGEGVGVSDGNTGNFAWATPVTVKFSSEGADALAVVTAADTRTWSCSAL